jgi:signal recognition particle GTPase
MASSSGYPAVYVVGDSIGVEVCRTRNKNPVEVHKRTSNMLKEIGLIFVIVDTAGRFGCG